MYVTVPHPLITHPNNTPPQYTEYLHTLLPTYLFPLVAASLLQQDFKYFFLTNLKKYSHSLFTEAKTWKPPRCPTQMSKKKWDYMHSGRVQSIFPNALITLLTRLFLGFSYPFCGLCGTSLQRHQMPNLQLSSKCNCSHWYWHTVSMEEEMTTSCCSSTFQDLFSAIFSLV